MMSGLKFSLHQLSGICIAAAAFAAATLVAARCGAVTIEMVTVGDAGNSADTTGYGAVSYTYQIGKYEVTIGQYTAFLNAVAKTDTHGLFKAEMSTDLNMAGITRSGSAGAYTYNAIAPSGSTPAGANSIDQRPIAYVSWFDAARFTNWMSNGQPTGLQGPTTTENGSYAISGTASAPARNTVNPNTGAAPLYFIPTENEWYKAAYYKGGGSNAGYWTFATQSDAVPINLIGSGSNRANFKTSQFSSGTFSVTQQAGFFPVITQNYLTNVGAFSASTSAYGTFDQNGNVSEWNDLIATSGTIRGIRGGSWREASYMASSQRITVPPRLILSGTVPTGFRLVAVPEPAACISALAGLAYGSRSMWRRRKRV